MSFQNNYDVRPSSSSNSTTQERWLKAQEWELAFWNRQNIKPVWWKRLLRPSLVLVGLRYPLQKVEYDDRNFWWKEKFNHYVDLPKEFTNVCELGCGPYTNIRLIREGRKIQYIHCSDPLASHYVKYETAWLGKACRLGLVSIDFHPAEDCPYESNYFDLTVLINVLDHVRNPWICLQQAIRITKPSGYFVFGQDLTDSEDKIPTNPGHPFVLHLAFRTF